MLGRVGSGVGWVWHFGDSDKPKISGSSRVWKVPAGAGGWERLRELLGAGRGKKCGITPVGRKIPETPPVGDNISLCLEN